MREEWLDWSQSKTFLVVFDIIGQILRMAEVAGEKEQTCGRGSQPSPKTRRQSTGLVVTLLLSDANALRHRAFCVSIHHRPATRLIRLRQATRSGEGKETRSEMLRLVRRSDRPGDARVWSSANGQMLSWKLTVVCPAGSGSRTGWHNQCPITLGRPTQQSRWSPRTAVVVDLATINCCVEPLAVPDFWRTASKLRQRELAPNHKVRAMLLRSYSGHCHVLVIASLSATAAAVVINRRGWRHRLLNFNA